MLQERHTLAVVERRCRGYGAQMVCRKFLFCADHTPRPLMPPLLDPNLFHRLQSEMDEENEYKRVSLVPFSS
jgi:hypothetical protein